MTPGTVFAYIGSRKPVGVIIVTRKNSASYLALDGYDMAQCSIGRVRWSDIREFTGTITDENQRRVATQIQTWVATR